MLEIDIVLEGETITKTMQTVLMVAWNQVTAAAGFSEQVRDPKTG